MIVIGLVLLFWNLGTCAVYRGRELLQTLTPHKTNSRYFRSRHKLHFRLLSEANPSCQTFCDSIQSCWQLIKAATWLGISWHCRDLNLLSEIWRLGLVLRGGMWIVHTHEMNVTDDCALFLCQRNSKVSMTHLHSQHRLFLFKFSYSLTNATVLCPD